MFVSRPQAIRAIASTEPNELTATIHDRMPVILAPKGYERWIAPAEPARLPIDLLHLFDANLMTTWKVSAAVGKCVTIRRSCAPLVQSL